MYDKLQTSVLFVSTSFCYWLLFYLMVAFIVIVTVSICILMASSLKNLVVHYQKGVANNVKTFRQKYTVDSGL